MIKYSRRRCCYLVSEEDFVILVFRFNRKPRSSKAVKDHRAMFTVSTPQKRRSLQYLARQPATAAIRNR